MSVETDIERAKREFVALLQRQDLPPAQAALGAYLNSALTSVRVDALALMMGAERKEGESFEEAFTRAQLQSLEASAAKLRGALAGASRLITPDRAASRLMQ